MVVVHMNRVAALTGSSYESLYGRFAGTEKLGVSL